ncbi:hypothetical protein E2C01_071438 [Portunus trituberculatus]|uniref:Uncharacterized protein n=1 Tax=Portunus trituberculatus TaxID=210409 RepID=A0A5B7HVD1_PORTR|nr:hypothetical protein [Portunus trituberculatus]
MSSLTRPAYQTWLSVLSYPAAVTHDTEIPACWPGDVCNEQCTAPSECLTTWVLMVKVFEIEVV